MATRDLTISTETASFTTEDFDEQLMYTGASVPLAAIRTADIVSRTVYKSGSAGASEAELTDPYVELYALYESVVSPKPSDDATKAVRECLDDSIELLEAALDSYDEELERETNLDLLKEKIRDLWEQRDKYNRHFLDAVVQLKVVARILDYEVLSKTQIESIRRVFCLLKKIELTREDRLLCWRTLEASGIDLNAPIRGYEEFELVLKEKASAK